MIVFSAYMSFLISHVPPAHSFFPKDIYPRKYRRIFFYAYKKKSEALIKKPFPSLDNVRDFT